MCVPLTIEHGETVLYIQYRSETNVQLNVKKSYRHLLNGDEQLQFTSERAAHRAANHLARRIEDDIKAQHDVR